MRDGLVFAALIERMTGIVLGEREFPRLKALAEDRARFHGLGDIPSYFRLLRREKESGEWRYLLTRITVKESSLFRGPAQFDALCQSVLPDRIGAGRTEIKIWSAGCARGEEPATLAVVLAECPPPPSVRIRIIATDVDRDALSQGEKAEFSERAVRRIPQHLLEKYFHQRCYGYQLKEKLRSRIEFEYFNLVQFPFSESWGDFDVVFLRNVLIYFRHSLQEKVLQAVAASLSDGGYLFVGPSESLWSLDSGLYREGLASCFVYRKTNGRIIPQPANIGRVQDEDGCIEPGPESSDEEPALQLSPNVVMPPELSIQDKDSLIIRKVVSSLSSGRVDVASRLLEEGNADPGNATVRALEGLTWRLKGEVKNALRAFRAALYLDESLYQVRYLLASCLSDLDWYERAIAEYDSVLRVLSTGGGGEIPEFASLGIPGRLTLGTLCRDALREIEKRHRGL